MRALVLVAAVVVGCSNDKIDAIEKRVAEIEHEQLRVEPQRFWYCIFHRAPEHDPEPFTTCFRTADECSNMLGGSSCITSPTAWCGKREDEPCTFTRTFCEAFNAPCHQVEP